MIQRGVARWQVRIIYISVPRDNNNHFSDDADVQQLYYIYIYQRVATILSRPSNEVRLAIRSLRTTRTYYIIIILLLLLLYYRQRRGLDMCGFLIRFYT